MANVLEVHHLEKSFGSVMAVNDLSFHLKAGEMLAIIGPNGAGKSTCFNLINGQLSPDQGTVLILGKKYKKRKPRHVWSLGVGRTFQVTSTFASMTVLENVLMVLLSHHHRLKSVVRKVSGLFVDEAMEILNRVGIHDQHDRPCGILAYGDLKRIELAMALANKPKLILMDEPTAGMGPTERRNLMEIVSNIVRTHAIGVLFIEHDMDVVFNYADRILVLKNGALLAEGSPLQVRNNKKVRESYLGAVDSTIRNSPVPSRG